MEKFSPKSPVDRFLSDVLKIDSNYSVRKKIYTALYEKGVLPKPQRKNYSGKGGENIALINYFKKNRQRGFCWNVETMSFEKSETKKDLDGLVQKIVHQKPVPIDKKSEKEVPLLKLEKNNQQLSLYEKYKRLTLKVASRDQLDENYTTKLEKALDQLMEESQKKGVSAKQFDRVCTNVRKAITKEFTDEKYKEVRLEYQRMDGKSFKELRDSFGGSGAIRRAMGFEKPKNGIYIKNIDFLKTKALDSDENFEQLIEKAAKEAALKFGVPAEKIKQLAIAVTFHESKGDPLAISFGYSLGIMQLGSDMFLGGERKAKFNQSPVNPLNPQEAIPRGVDFIAYLYKMFKGNKTQVLQAYNCGENKLKEALKQGEGTKKPYSKFLSMETQHYVRKMERDYKELQQKNPDLVDFEAF